MSFNPLPLCYMWSTVILGHGGTKPPLHHIWKCSSCLHSHSCHVFSAQTLPWPKGPSPQAKGNAVKSTNVSLGPSALSQPGLYWAGLLHTWTHTSTPLLHIHAAAHLPPGSCPEQPQPHANTRRDRSCALLNADAGWGCKSVLASAASSTFRAPPCPDWSVPHLPGWAVWEKLSAGGEVGFIYSTMRKENVRCRPDLLLFISV